MFVPPFQLPGAGKFRRFQRRIGDWWAYGQHAYGERKAIVEADDWEGPSYQTCKDAAWVCGAVQRSRRRDLLSFSAHRDIAALAAEIFGKLAILATLPACDIDATALYFLSAPSIPDDVRDEAIERAAEGEHHQVTPRRQ